MDGATQRAQAVTPDELSYSKMSEPAPAAGWKVDRVEIRPAENGGFIANCSKSRPGSGGGDSVGPTANGSDYQNKDYAFTSMPEMMQFLQTELAGAAPSGPAELPMPMADDDYMGMT